MQEGISVQQALEIILAHTFTLSAEDVHLAEVQGHILAEDVEADAPIPPFDNSGVDGFAVFMEDVSSVPATLEIQEVVAAGKVEHSVMSKGKAIQIMTGAPVPEGAEGVVMVEWTELLSNNRVKILRAPKMGQHIRKAGSDLPKGALVIEAGEKLHAPHLGMLATIGKSVVQVYQRPKVAILTTGDELVSADRQPQFGQIRNSNASALVGQVISSGGDVVWQGHALDQKASVKSHIEQSLAVADVLLISGGVSMGEFDYVRQVLDEIGWKPHFWKVRQRPGKPLVFGTYSCHSEINSQNKLIFGLPGNPVSSSVCFEQYVRPCLMKMQGAQQIEAKGFYAVLATDFGKVKGLHFFARGIAFTDKNGQMFVSATGEQGSHIYSSMMKANCMVHLPEEWENAKVGTLVRCSWLPWA